MIGSVRIVADENIPYVEEAFGPLGSVQRVSGRTINSAILKDADILLVRSITKVNESLLRETNVKMVATATIGTDHIDEAYLQKSGIFFASAAGSNSNSVSEYITAALLVVSRRGDFSLAGKTIGVIGVGNVGSKVAKKCEVLGMKVLKNDPPLKDATGSKDFCELSDLIIASDFITVHVPLTMDGKYPTYHLVNNDFLCGMNSHAFLLNSSRGSVVDGRALGEALEKQAIAGAVLDVWEHEPNIDSELLKKVELGTPHIAGYSFDGKVNGTEMIYKAACRFLGVTPSWDPKSVLPAPIVPEVHVESDEGEIGLGKLVKMLYDIESDDRNLREMLERPEMERSSHFDLLRKNYPVRREFFNTKVQFSQHVSEGMKEKIRGLGFRCER
jgi:erythronate-4-phosphate dehydrogenase